MQKDNFRRCEAEIRAYSARLQSRRVTGGSLEWTSTDGMGVDIAAFLALDDAKMRDLQIAEEVAHASIVKFVRSEAAHDAFVGLMTEPSAIPDAQGAEDAMAHLIASLSTLHYEDAAFPLFQLPACWLVFARSEDGADIGAELFPSLFRGGDGAPHILLDAARGFRETTLSLQTIMAEIIVDYAVSLGLTTTKAGKAEGLLKMIGGARAIH